MSFLNINFQSNFSCKNKLEINTGHSWTHFLLIKNVPSLQSKQASIPIPLHVLHDGSQSIHRSTYLSANISKGHSATHK